MIHDDDETFNQSGTGIRPDVLAACKRRNREAERRDREAIGECWQPGAPRTDGTVMILQCSCGARAGFRIVGDFQSVRLRVMARKAGWANVHRSENVGTCPGCVQVDP